MPKILIVDDNEAVRFLVPEELIEMDLGYECICMENGYRLLETIEEEKPDLVVLDIKMVDYNGLDLLQDIRNKFYDLPVIMFTAYDSFKEDMKSMAADFYVIKSFNLTELKNKIAMALEASGYVWERMRVEELTLDSIRKKLISLLNTQDDPVPVADSIPGCALLMEEISKVGFSQEKLGEIDVMFKKMCNDFYRENQEMTAFISDYLLKNYKQESIEIASVMYDGVRPFNLASCDRFCRLYAKVKSQFREKISFLSKNFATVEKDLNQGRLSAEIRGLLSKYAHIEDETLDILIPRWHAKLKLKDIKGIPIDSLVRTFKSLSVDTLESGRIQSIILKEVRHDLRNVISRLIMRLKKRRKDIPKNILDELGEIQARLPPLFERLSEEPTINLYDRIKEVRQDLKNTISTFTVYLKKRRKDIPKNILDELGEIRDRLSPFLDRLSEISVFSAEIKTESFRLNSFMESSLEDLGIRNDPRISVQIETQSEKINTDPRFLGIALRQVIQNATEAVGSDGKIKIAVKDGAWGRQVLFNIEDDGPGIPENLLEEVFKPGVGYRKMGHGGMGLALSKEALKEIGGNILIHSVIDKGTTVEIRLYQEV